jgi:hypothetical protein
MLFDIVPDAAGLPGFATLGDPALVADTATEVLATDACELDGDPALVGLVVKSVFGLLNSGIADPLAKLLPDDDGGEEFPSAGAPRLLDWGDGDTGMVVFRIGAVLGSAKLELEGVTDFKLELLKEDANWPSVFVVFGIAFEDADGPELLAEDDKLADTLWVAEFEFDSPDLDANGRVALVDPEVALEDTAGPVLLVALDEGPVTELAFSGVVLIDELELLD